MTKIDITPKWSGVIPALLEVLKNPKADAESKQFVEEELLRLAKIADSANNN